MQDQCGDIQPSGGFAPGSPTFFCEGEIVEFINESDPGVVDSTIIDWGDGTVEGGPGTPSFSHIYDFAEDTCLIASSSITLPIRMEVVRNCPAGISRNCLIVFVRIRVDPFAQFEVDNGLCVGEDICFDNTTCQNDDSADYTWNFANQGSSSEENPCFSFDQTGAYPITLIAENQCGSDTYTQFIEVIDEPTVTTDVFFDPDNTCVPSIVNLGSESLFATSYCWVLEPNNEAYFFIDSTDKFSPDPRLLFVDGGFFDVSLITANACGMDTTNFELEIPEAPTITLSGDEPPLGCGTLLYTPDISIEGSVDTYSWSFPGGTPSSANTADPGDIFYNQPGQYAVQLAVDGICGNIAIAVDTLLVLPQTVIAFDSLGPICNTSSMFQLPASPPDGDWSGQGVTEDGIFDPAAAMLGENVLTYTAGPDGCMVSDELTVTVLPAEVVDIGSERDTFCIDNGSVLLSFSPSGGDWMGNGITNAQMGIFNPAVAGPGNHELVYVYQALSGCFIEARKYIEVIPLPQLSVDDALSTCAIVGDILLPDLLNISVSPSGGNFQWTGAGIINATTGLFNAADLGADTTTIQLAYTDQQGCSSVDDFFLELTPFVPAVAAFEDTTLCSGDSEFTLLGFPANGAWSGDNIDPITGIIDVPTLDPGNYLYTYTIEAGTPCESSAEVDVTIVDSGNSVSVGDELYVCETEGIINLPSASPGNGIWDGAGLVNGNQVNVQALMLGANTFTYTVDFLPAACNSQSVDINVLEEPVPGFEYDSIGCVGELLSFNNTSIGGVLYLWSFGDNGESDDENPSYLYPLPGTYPVTLQVSNTDPVSGLPVCTTELTQDILLIQGPGPVDFVVDQVSGCGPLVVNFDNLSQGSLVSYFWDFDNDSTSVLTEPGWMNFAGGVEDTSYTVVLTAANLCAEVSDSLTITVFPDPVANFGVLINEACSGDTILVNNISTGNIAGSDFAWTVSGNNTMSTYGSFNLPPIVTFTDTLPGIYTIQLTSTNACGVDTAIQQITVDPTDVNALINTSAFSVCVFDTLQLTSVSTPGAPVSWVISDNSTYNTELVAHVFQDTGTFQVALYVEGCGFDSMVIQVDVLALPEISVVHELTACAAESVAFQLTSNAPGNTLYFGDGDSTLLNNATHVYENAGMYPLLAIAENNAGCRAEWTGQLSVAPKPLAALAVVDSVCRGEATTFISESVGNSSCLWLFGDETMGDDCNSSHAYANTGTFVASLIVISDFGCRDTAVQQVYVRPSPDADFDMSVLENCAFDPIVFQDASTDATGWAWSLGDGSTQNSTAFEHSYIDGGIYQVQLVASYEGVCRDTATRQLVIYDLPEFAFELEPECTQEEGYTLTIQTEDENFAFVFGDNYSLAGKLHPRLQNGDYRIEVESPEGCLDEAPVFVPQIQELMIGLLEDEFSIRLGESVQLELEFNETELEFQWTPAEGLDNPSIPNPVSTPFQTLQYVVSARNKAGCVKLDTAIVEVTIDRERGIYLPNAFTPDDSGHNDFFRLLSTNPGLVSLDVFRVFDRWGNMVFEVEGCPASDLQVCSWDGNYKEQKAEQGVYTYYAEIRFIDDVVRVLKGNVTLIR